MNTLLIVIAESIIHRIKRYPVLVMNLGQAVIGVLLAFETVDWTGAQAGQVMVLIAAILSVISLTVITPTSAPVLKEGTVVKVKSTNGHEDQLVTL